MATTRAFAAISDRIRNSQIYRGIRGDAVKAIAEICARWVDVAEAKRAGGRSVIVAREIERVIDEVDSAHTNMGSILLPMTPADVLRVDSASIAQDARLLESQIRDAGQSKR